MKLRKINDTLFRSDQPAVGDLPGLRAMGVDTIINLRREEPEVWRAEQTRAGELGMKFLHFPFYGIFGASARFLDAVLLEVARPENGVVLVHCKNGEDRTSLIVGLHRVLHDGWTPEEAWEREFVAHGHDPEQPRSPWKSRWANFWYRNVGRTFRRHAKKRGFPGSRPPA